VEGRAGPDGDDATLDLDATIVRTKAGKEDAAPTHKRTYGHHPLAAMLAETGEVLAGMFRPGNAGGEFIEVSRRYSLAASARSSTWPMSGLHGNRISSSQPASVKALMVSVTCVGVVSAPATICWAKSPRNP
jgi:hypothetical protein